MDNLSHISEEEEEEVDFDIEFLSISGLGLDCIPTDVGLFQRLTTLCCNDNFISDIPNVLTQLPLRWLYLCGNQLTDSAVQMVDWTRFQCLQLVDLSNNALTQFPQGIAQCQTVKFLSIADNEQIQSIQEGMLQEFERLQCLNIAGTRILKEQRDPTVIKEIQHSRVSKIIVDQSQCLYLGSVYDRKERDFQIVITRHCVSDQELLMKRLLDKRKMFQWPSVPSMPQMLIVDESRFQVERDEIPPQPEQSFDLLVESHQEAQQFKDALKVEDTLHLDVLNIPPPIIQLLPDDIVSPPPPPQQDEFALLLPSPPPSPEFDNMLEKVGVADNGEVDVKLKMLLPPPSIVPRQSDLNPSIQTSIPCGSCNQPVSLGWVQVLGNQIYHRDCI
ncbi:hypothetical protein MP228_008517 [Amoeboaphelidium protococcarum]|nr:hypothetical protein MP228_008517 [Amoeboaphelidium protococcarum]